MADATRGQFKVTCVTAKNTSGVQYLSSEPICSISRDALESRSNSSAPFLGVH